MRAFVLLALVAACFVVAPGKANAQTTYNYQGHQLYFILLQMGGIGSFCSTPTAGDTYTASNYVFASITVTSPLAASMGLTQIYWSGTTVGNAPGFLLTMQDGQQTFSSADPTLSVIAEVSTDAHGNIISSLVSTDAGPPATSTIVSALRTIPAHKAFRIMARQFSPTPNTIPYHSYSGH